MQPLELLDCTERIRAYCLQAEPRLAARLEQMRRYDWRDKPNSFFMERMLAAAAELDDYAPAGRRRLRQLMSSQAVARFFAGEDEEPAAAEVSGVVYACDGEQSREQELLAQAGRSFAVFEGADELHFSRLLARSANVHEAARLAGKTFPLLRGNLSYAFLRDVGYPAFVPAGATRRLLARLGLTRAKAGLTSEALREFFGAMEEMARLACLSAAELDLLLGVFCGARKFEGIEALCTATPACERCCAAAFCRRFAEQGPPARGQSRPIRTWAADERPRERLTAGEKLTPTELLAILLRTGAAGQSALELASRLRQAFGSLHRLGDATPREIARAGIKGIGLAKAAQIKAAIELGRRIAAPENDERDGLRQVSSSRDVFDIYRPVFQHRTQEEFLLLILNTKNRVAGEISVSTGTLNSSIVHPRDVFKHALKEAAAAVIFVHNHPSGDPAPSAEDRALTARLCEAGRLLGIKVLDHIIVGSQRYYSFADEGELK